MNKKSNHIRSNTINYRQGFIEISTAHPGYVNIETWEISPSVDISGLDLMDGQILDDDVVANTEIELSIAEAKELIKRLQEKIENIEK